MTRATRVFLTITAFGVLAALLAGSDARAQYGVGQPRRRLPPANLDGTLKGAKGAVVYVLANSKPYVVNVTPNTAVIVTGEADTGVLARGMWVRFNAKVDEKKGVCTEDIKAIATFTPSEAQQPGVQKEGGENEYFIAGQIKSLNKIGAISVVAGKANVRGQIAADAKVTLGSHIPGGCRFGKDGDSITVSGQIARPPINNQPGLVVAQKIELKLSQPLSTGKKIVPKKGEPEKTEKPADTKAEAKP